MASETALSVGSTRDTKPCPVRINSSLRALTQIQIGAGRFNEQWLQELVYRHPNCLPAREIEAGFGELVSVGMEIPTPHGPIDNLLITPDGQIALVEAKLWRNPQARREVVAQALDYASCLFEWDYEELEQRVLKASFGDRPRPACLYDLFQGKDGLPLPDFVDAINTNLRRGRALILVVGDGIRTEAKRLAAMLQSHAGAHFTFGLVEKADLGAIKMRSKFEIFAASTHCPKASRAKLNIALHEPILWILLRCALAHRSRKAGNAFHPSIQLINKFRDAWRLPILSEVPGTIAERSLIHLHPQTCSKIFIVGSGQILRRAPSHRIGPHLTIAMNNAQIDGPTRGRIPAQIERTLEVCPHTHLRQLLQEGAQTVW